MSTKKAFNSYRELNLFDLNYALCECKIVLIKLSGSGVVKPENTGWSSSFWIIAHNKAILEPKATTMHEISIV